MFLRNRTKTMKIKYKNNRASRGITLLQLIGVVSLCSLLIMAPVLTLMGTFSNKSSDALTSKDSNKIISGTVKDVRYYGVNTRHFVEVKFSDGRAMSFRVTKLKEFKIGVLNKIELRPANSFESDDSYYLIDVVFEETVIPDGSVGIEANSHYEPLIEKIDTK